MNKPQPKKPVNPLHHIRRFDNEARRTYAWYVGVMHNKQSTGKYFSDFAHGGKEKSLQAAIKFRDKLIKVADNSALRMWHRTKLRTDNKSGVAGVYRIERISKLHPNSSYLYWIAAGLNEYGVKRSRNFSITRYGEERARQMAIVEREHQLARVRAFLDAKENVHSRGRRTKGTLR